MTDARVIDTEQATEIIRKSSVITGGQRKADVDAFIDTLDPEGRHLLTRVLAFHNDGPHDRCTVQYKVVGTDEPVEGRIDIAHEHYERLMSYDDYMAQPDPS